MQYCYETLAYSVWIRKGGEKLQMGSEWCQNKKDLKYFNSCGLEPIPAHSIQRDSLCIKKEVWAMAELLTFELWPEKHLLLTKPLPSRRGYGTKSIIHGARAWSQLISVQSRRNRLKLIRRLPAQHLPEENGSTFAVSQSFTVLQQHRYEAETDKSGINHFIFICLLKKKKNLHWEYISRGKQKHVRVQLYISCTWCSGSNNVFHICPAAPHLHFAIN